MGGVGIPRCRCDLLTGVAQPGGERSGGVPMATQAQNCRSHQLRSHLPVFFMQRRSLGLQQCPKMIFFLDMGITRDSIAQCLDKILLQVTFFTPFRACKVINSLRGEKYLHIELEKNTTIHTFV